MTDEPKGPFQIGQQVVCHAVDSLVRLEPGKTYTVVAVWPPFIGVEDPDTGARHGVTGPSADGRPMRPIGNILASRFRAVPHSTKGGERHGGSDHPDQEA